MSLWTGTGGMEEERDYSSFTPSRTANACCLPGEPCSSPGHLLCLHHAFRLLVPGSGYDMHSCLEGLCLVGLKLCCSGVTSQPSGRRHWHGCPDVSPGPPLPGPDCHAQSHSPACLCLVLPAPPPQTNGRCMITSVYDKAIKFSTSKSSYTKGEIINIQV